MTHLVGTNVKFGVMKARQNSLKKGVSAVEKVYVILFI